VACRDRVVFGPVVEVGPPVNLRGWWHRSHIPTKGEGPSAAGLDRPRAPVIVEIPMVVGDACSSGLRLYRLREAGGGRNGGRRGGVVTTH